MNIPKGTGDYSVNLTIGQMHAFLEQDGAKFGRTILRTYRVTAWDPETNREFNVGLFQAETRAEAIEKAYQQAQAGCHSNEEKVLDAYEVSSGRA